MDVYTTPFHTAVGVAEVEQYLRQALGGAMNAYGTIHRGALAARVWVGVAVGTRSAASGGDWGAGHARISIEKSLKSSPGRANAKPRGTHDVGQALSAGTLSRPRRWVGIGQLYDALPRSS